MKIRRRFSSLLLHSEIRKIIPLHLRLLAPAYILAALLLPFLFSAASTALAGSATWNLNPTNGDWFTASNWTPKTVPNGPNDTATFGVSNVTGISTSFYTMPPEVNGIVFDPGASAYSITVISVSPMTISGAGITNDSGSTQNFNAGAGFPSDGAISFTNNATAGSLTAFNNSAATCDSGGDARTTFSGASSAGGGTFTNDGGDAKCGSSGAFTSFSDRSTAANGTFINNGGSDNPFGDRPGGHTSFFDTSTAANGTFINNGGDFEVESFTGGFTSFSGRSTAGNAVLIANGGPGGGGAILFTGDSTGNTARVEVFGNGNGDSTNGSLDISDHNPPGVTIGSIEGSGTVHLGANNLIVGSNNLSTTFAGVIQDFGAGGSFSKIGTGTLTLTGENTYTGGTTIEGGKLIVSNRSGSGTGSGAVQVNKGTLRGKGTIAGAVTLGTGSGPGAILSPGEGRTRPRTLNIQSTLTFNSDATYDFGLNSKTGIADKVVANGVIVSGAIFSFAEFGNSALSLGTVLTVIDNTAATPIAGRFANLADGSIFTIGNTYQVSYEGNDGNDLTLTVVLPAFAVTTTDPACNNIINTPPNDFVVNLTEAADRATVQASDFTVNGTPAGSFVLSNGNATITFHFNSSPVVTQGPQTMHIPAGAFNRASDGMPNVEFMCTFCYAITPLQVVSTSPPVGGTFSPPAPGDYQYDVNFNQPVDQASVQTSDLTLFGNVGWSVTGVSVVNGNTTVRFTVHFNFGGSVRASIGAGSITASRCNDNAAFSGMYTVEGCPEQFYTTATGAGTITSGGTDIGNHCDDCATLVNLPFPVSVYGTPISVAYAGSNGSLQFSTVPNPKPFFFDGCVPVNPGQGGPFLNTLFPHYDDLRTDQLGTCPACGIFTRTVGSPPNRQFVIRYKTTYFNHPGTAEFEVLLTEGSDTLSVIYGVSDNSGAEAASGIQQDLTQFTSFSCNEAVLTPGLRVDYIPIPCFTGGD